MLCSLELVMTCKQFTKLVRMIVNCDRSLPNSGLTEAAVFKQRSVHFLCKLGLRVIRDHMFTLHLTTS